MNKKLAAIVCSLGLIVTTTGFANADNTEYMVENSNLKDSLEDSNSIQLKDASFDLPYNMDDINLERKEFDNTVEYTVRDKSTNEVLLVFGEETLSVEKNVYMRETNSIGVRMSKNVYTSFNKGPCKFRLNQPITISTSGSFRWISGAGRATLNQETGGDWKLSSTSIANNWKAGSQLSSIRVDAMTTITVNTNGNVSGEFSRRKLENAGFDMQLIKTENYINYYTGRFTPKNRFGFTWNVQSNSYTTINSKLT